jgi:hypothetical protein
MSAEHPRGTPGPVAKHSLTHANRNSKAAGAYMETDMPPAPHTYQYPKVTPIAAQPAPKPAPSGEPPQTKS